VTRRALIGLSGLLCVLLLALYAMFIAARGTTPSIRDSEGRQVQGSIASLEEIVLGGARQWILLRGHDVEKPLMLFLHGGPGMPAMYLAHDFQRKLERDFVVVHWDRRGAGKSYSAGADPATLTVRRTLGETLELTDKLRARFEKQRIVLVGHSWGSYLAMLAIRERPDAYSGYVGIGQMAADRERVAAHRIEAIRPLAEAAGDEDLLARLDSGGVTEDDLLRHGVELRGATTFWPILRTGLMAPEYDLFDAMNVGRGASRVARLMRDDILTGPLDRQVLEVSVPVFFFLGRHDLNTPSDQAAEYFDRLQAPLKELVWFEESAHFPFWTESDRFRREMARVGRAVAAYWRSRSSPSHAETR
jgi:pimeloyl-ACP methyl ester carboxylesterase